MVNTWYWEYSKYTYFSTSDMLVKDRLAGNNYKSLLFPLQRLYFDAIAGKICGDYSVTRRF